MGFSLWFIVILIFVVLLLLFKCLIAALVFELDNSVGLCIVVSILFLFLLLRLLVLLIVFN